MAKGVYKDLLILLLIAVVLLGAGYYIAQKLWDSDLNLTAKITYGQEKKIGNVFREMVESEYKVVRDGYPDSALHIITDRLVKVIDSSQYSYEFTILDNAEINAFTIPDGNIYVFSGLLKFCETPEEVAAVLAHEIGHAENRHVVSKLIREASVTVLLSIASGGDPSVVAKLAKQLLGSSFDRDMETEADDYALKLLEKASISPKTLARFFERLKEKNMDYDERLELLMSHPATDKRMEHARMYKTKNGFKSAPFNIDWNKVRK